MSSEHAVSQSALRHPFRAVAAAFALAMLAGCAQMPATQGMQAPATKDTLLPTVSVVVVRNGDHPFGYSCFRNDPNYLVCINQDPIEVPGDEGVTNTITWSLVTPGWNFGDQGIDIRPRGQWRPVEGAIGPKVQSFSNKKNNKAYKYQINVKPEAHIDAGKPLQWDPSIMN